MKNTVDELNDKQEDNEKVLKIKEEINAGHKMQKKSQPEVKDKKNMEG